MCLSPARPGRVVPGARFAVSGNGGGAGLGHAHISQLQLPLRRRPDLPADFFTCPPFAPLSAPTMATFPQPSDELQRQQELASKWEPEPTVSPACPHYLVMLWLA